jgi:hypothetical protein
LVALNLVLLWILPLGVLLLHRRGIRTRRRHDERCVDFSPHGRLEPASAAPDHIVTDTGTVAGPHLAVEALATAG